MTILLLGYSICQLVYIKICTTLTPQIKEKSQFIYHILDWLWNVNEIYALTTVQYQIYCTI